LTDGAQHRAAPLFELVFDSVRCDFKTTAPPSTTTTTTTSAMNLVATAMLRANYYNARLSVRQLFCRRCQLLSTHAPRRARRLSHLSNRHASGAARTTTRTTTRTTR
jgi:hypothetical protein